MPHPGDLAILTGRYLDNIGGDRSGQLLRQQYGDDAGGCAAEPSWRHVRFAVIETPTQRFRHPRGTAT
jgi:hypothetical protein